MKETIDRVKSFLIFDSPLRNDSIRENFANTHANFQGQYPAWSLAATRKKVIAHFWLNQVSSHYLVLVFLGSAGAIAMGSPWTASLFAILFGGMVCLVTLVMFNYWPAFYVDFLPKLDTVIAEQEKLLVSAEEVTKCKRTQFSAPSLVVIFYIFCKTSHIELPQANDQTALMLNNLFGTDKDKLKQNLHRLINISRLSPKERAEMQKGIDNGRSVFEGLGSPKAQAVLDQLELKLNKP